MTSEEPFHGVDAETLKAMKRSLAVLRAAKADVSIYKIDSRVLLGSLGAALDEAELTKHRVTHIVCVARGIKNAFVDKYKYKTVEILDSASESLLDHLPETLAWMNDALSSDPQAKILVHCFAGRSRSVSIILAYLMVWHRITLRVALHHVRSIRSAANPNTSFMRHLKAFEQELFARYGEPENSPGTRDNVSGPGFENVEEALSALLPGAKARVRFLEHTPTNIRNVNPAEYVACIEERQVSFFSKANLLIVILAVLVSVAVSGAARVIQQSIRQ